MYGKSNTGTYITICKIDHQWEFALWLRKLKQGLCINLEGWDRAGEGQMYGKSNTELTLLYVKQIANRILLYGSGNSNRGSVSTQWGGMGREMVGRFKREGIYVYLWLIHAEVLQKATKFCKAIMLQLKKLRKKLTSQAIFQKYQKTDKALARLIRKNDKNFHTHRQENDSLYYILQKFKKII